MFLSLSWRGDGSDRQTAIGGEGGGRAEIDERLAEITVANTSKVCQFALSKCVRPRG